MYTAAELAKLGIQVARNVTARKIRGVYHTSDGRTIVTDKIDKKWVTL